MICIPSAVEELDNNGIGVLSAAVLDIVLGHEFGRIGNSLEAFRTEVVIPCTFEELDLGEIAVCPVEHLGNLELIAP